MTKIRPATREDIPRIVEMAQRFYPLSPYPSLYGSMPDAQAAGLAIVTMEGVTLSDGQVVIAPGVMLVAEKDGAVIGMLSLAADCATFNPLRRITSELVFWIEPEHRGSTLAIRMIRAGEDAAREKGIHVNRMAVLSSSPEGTAELYELIGYELTESYYSKAL